MINLYDMISINVVLEKGYEERERDENRRWEEKHHTKSHDGAIIEL